MKIKWKNYGQNFRKIPAMIAWFAFQITSFNSCVITDRYFDLHQNLTL